MKKKVLLASSLFLSILILIANSIGTFDLCGGSEYGTCMDIASNIITVLFIIIPFFIFSLITYSMKEIIFQIWWKFARVWVPLSMLAILISPDYSSNWMFPVEKGNVALFTSILFIIISIGIIIWKSIELKRVK
jgi:hypothetical protein